jgi:hypothetical protein
MVTLEYFYELVNEGFAFLEKEYSFDYVGTTDIPRIIDVIYRKGPLMVNVKYSRANRYIEVSLFNHVPVIAPPIYQLDSRVMLMDLLKRDNPEFDYNDYLSLMPSSIPLEESVKKTAGLLKYFGASILSGEEWVDAKSIYSE